LRGKQREALLQLNVFDLRALREEAQRLCPLVMGERARPRWRAFSPAD
jgi:hypothetical protein